MRTKFTLPDGGRASAVQVMTRESDDAFRWKSVSRLIDGSLQPDIDEVTVVRKPAESTAPQRRKPPTTASHEHANRRESAMKKTTQIRDFRRLGALRFLALEPAPRRNRRRRRRAAGARSAGFRAPGAAANVNRSPSMSQPGGGGPGTAVAASTGKPGGIQRPNAGRPGGLQRPSAAAPGGHSAPERSGQPGRHPATECRRTGWDSATERRCTRRVAEARTPAASSARMPVRQAGFSGRTPAHPAASSAPMPGDRWDPATERRRQPAASNAPWRRGRPSSDSLHDFLGTGGSNTGGNNRLPEGIQRPGEVRVSRVESSAPGRRGGHRTQLGLRPAARRRRHQHRRPHECRGRRQARNVNVGVGGNTTNVNVGNVNVGNQRQLLQQPPGLGLPAPELGQQCPHGRRRSI